jgi:hypothetical protein
MKRKEQKKYVGSRELPISSKERKRAKQVPHHQRDSRN